MSNPVFITGGTGYLGARLIPLLLKEGYSVKALVRKGSEHKLPPGCAYIVADPFDAASFARQIEKDSTFIQLLGVRHPGPGKKDLFYRIDLRSAQASAKAAAQAGCGHFVYVSVAQTPTRIMKDYQACRAAGEAAISEAGLKATFIRPWYVIGPGHYWPLLFYPLFELLKWLPATAHKASALQPVFLQHMLAILVEAIKSPPAQTIRIVEIAEIKHANRIGTQGVSCV